MKTSETTTRGRILLCLLLLVAANLAAAQSLEAQLLAETPDALAAAAQRDGDALRGAGIFYGQTMACATCHGVGDRPATLGPDLAKINRATSDAALVEAVLQPSKTIAKGFAVATVQTVSGTRITGTVVEESDAGLLLRDTEGKRHTLRPQDITSLESVGQSAMPAGQVNQLAGRRQFLDLMRFLMELRDGGPQRARELQPPTDPRAQRIPDLPLPWRPVVQRGEVEVPGDRKYPRAVAMGFVGGTVLFDADQLATVALWFDGFVANSPQHYFGLYWKAVGGALERLGSDVHPLRVRVSEEADWQGFEPPTTSDPNTGTRFEGYQIGNAAIRLRYRLLVGEEQIMVSEEVRAESRTDWRGFARKFHFTGLPPGAQVSLALPAGEDHQAYATGDSSRALMGYRSKEVRRVVSAQGGSWLKNEADPKIGRLISSPATAEGSLALRIDAWNYRGRHAEPTAAERGSLVDNPPVMNDAFDQPRNASKPLPIVKRDRRARSQVARPAVQPQENIDEFEPARGRFLRFVTTRTTGNAEPGIDELEVYGADPKVNLALQGKASASSVIAGYPIHQIPHLNDGKLGNPHSWISAERGGGWAQIEFPETVEMRKIVWARDRTGVCRDRLAVAYRIEVSQDGKNWFTVGDESGRAQGHGGSIRRDAAPGYVMEAIPAPFPSWRPSDIAFGDDGTMYAIAMTEGQIWRARTPPVGRPMAVEWQRFATGLYHPIGLAVVDGRLFVAQKPEITEVIDRDGDGVADEYRSVAGGWGLSTGWHEYCFGLAVDPQKNLWFALNTGYFWTNPGYVNPGRWRGSILRVAQGSEKLEVMATGCRVPNGIARGPDGNIFFTDNQGDWIQACKLAGIVEGRFYGHPETKADALPKGSYPDGRSAIWLPYDRSRSTSGPVWDSTQGRFGPFSNQMFLGDVGYGANEGIMRVALEKVDGEYQGACIRFVAGQPRGCERMKFGPDNQLYMASLTSGLTRMAFDGETPMAIHSVRIRPRGAGFVVHLTKALAADAQPAAGQFRVKRYHYLYTGNYGSPQASEQAVPVHDVELSPDRKAITLTFPVETYPIGMVYAIKLGDLSAKGGDKLLHNEAWYTVHKIPQ
ncbi:MAG: putative heme-binding domain-containing protein [Rhodothermales bacterium]|jgi:putative heme-binding domain-containing protein